MPLELLTRRDLSPASDRAAFKHAVRAGFLAVFPNWSDEDLIHRPSEAIRFAGLIRLRLQDDALEECVVLRGLQNLRKKKGNAFGKARCVINVDHELRAIRCDFDRDVFEERIADVYNGLFRGQPVEEVLCHPTPGSSEFCRAMRLSLHCPQLGEFLICHTLTALRKRGNERLVYPRTRVLIATAPVRPI